jgi:hypothetical protein
MADDPQQTTDELGTSDQTDDAQTENENADVRLDTFERRVEDHQANLDGLKDHLGGDGDGLGPVSTRRGVLTAGGVLGLLGLGAGTASADASGQVGTSSDPLSELYTEELNGGITGDTSLTNIAGQGLTIDNSGNLKISGGSRTSKLKTSGSTVTAMNVLDGSSSVSASSDGATPPNILGGHPSNNTGASTVKGVTISGGGGDSASSKDNTASADFATIGGGNYHLASGSNATIAGGNFNKATASNATVGGGTTNDASGSYATIPGGNNNLADGDNSFAAGRFGETNGNDGAFVWGDSSSTRAKAQATDEVRFQATGGFVIAPESEQTNMLDVQDSGGNSVLTVDTSNDQVDIADTASNDTLTLKHDNTSGILSTSTGDLKLSPSGNVDLNGNNLETSTDGLTVTTNDTGNLTLDPGANNTVQVNSLDSQDDSILTVDSSGNVGKGTKSTADIGGSFTGVLATVGSEQLLGTGEDGRVMFDEIVYNTGGNFNTNAGNHEFIVPSDGYYRVTTQVRFGNPEGGPTLRIRINVDGNTRARNSLSVDYDQFQGLTVVKTFDLVSGEKVSIDATNIDQFAKAYIQPEEKNTYLNIEKIE